MIGPQKYLQLPCKTVKIKQGQSTIAIFGSGVWPTITTHTVVRCVSLKQVV